LLASLRAVLQQGDNLLYCLLALAALTLLLLLGWLLLLAKLRQQNRRLTALTRGADGQSLEAVLAAHLARVEQTERRMEALEQAVGVLQAQMPDRLRYARLIRYDAFDDVGGEQSFSLALLDQRGNGVVLTSVYSRMDMRVYAKAIQDGRSSHALSEEEQRLLREALTP
jgi:hypothetical protein